MTCYVNIRERERSFVALLWCFGMTLWLCDVLSYILSICVSFFLRYSSIYVFSYGRHFFLVVLTREKRAWIFRVAFSAVLLLLLFLVLFCFLSRILSCFVFFLWKIKGIIARVSFIFYGTLSFLHTSVFTL